MDVIRKVVFAKLYMLLRSFMETSNHQTLSCFQYQRTSWLLSDGGFTKKLSYCIDLK